MTDFVKLAKAYYKAGYSVIPVTSTKIPTIREWRQYQNKPMTIEECEKYFKGAYGMALIGGVNGVIMLDRAGNNSPKSPIRLTGKVEYIETPYNKKEIENFLNKDVRKIAKEISNYYSKYLELLS